MSRTEARRSPNARLGAEAKHPRKGPSRTLIGASLATLLASFVLAWFVWGRDVPPPLDADPEVRATVDALFTAVNARREPLLADCEQRLKNQREAGELSVESAEYLSDVIARARAGQWEPAARRLYSFVHGR